MSDAHLENYYESVILPMYGDLIKFPIKWKSHGKVGLDTWAHYFDDKSSVEFVLLYEDFPGNEYLGDDLSHELVKCGNKSSLQISESSGKEIDNIFGYFTLYKEKIRK